MKSEATAVIDTPPRQRLAAILAADAAGYTRLMAADERPTVAALDSARAMFRLLELTPAFTVSRYLSVAPYKNPEHRRRIGEIFLAAGVPK